MKKIITFTLLLTVLSFACTKKLECWDYSQCPYLSVYIEPIYHLPDGEIKDLNLQFDSIPNINPDIFYSKKNIYYSEVDSNIIVYLGYPALLLFRTCQNEEECVAQAQEHDIVETFKHEFMRLQKGGVYPMSEEYADSVSDHIVDKLRNFEGKRSNVVYDSIYAYVAYNSQCAMGVYNIYDGYYFDDRAYMNECYWPPDPFAEELDSCNASLESNVVAARLFADNDVDVTVTGNVMSFSGLSAGPVNVAIMSPLGKVIEQHRVSGTEISLRTKLPRGSYIVEISVAGKRLYKRVWVR